MGGSVQRTHCHELDPTRLRERAYAVEWMAANMVARFVAPDAKRLEGKTRHDGLAPDRGKWINNVSRDAARWAR